MKSAFERKEAAWKEVLGARGEVAKDRFMEIYKEEKLKSAFQSKNEVNEQFGRKMNQVEDGIRSYFGRR